MDALSVPDADPWGFAQASLDDLEHQITCGLAPRFLVGYALRTIRDRALYHAYASSFDVYCRERLRLGHRLVGRLLAVDAPSPADVAHDLPLVTAATDTLIAMLGSPHASSAILELGRRRAREAVDPLIAFMADPTTPWQPAWYVPAALRAIGDDRAVEPLIAALATPGLSGQATEALAAFHDPRALEPLIVLFDQQPIASLATVLGRWGDPRAVPSLIAAMQHPDAHVRFYTARALGRLGDIRALPALAWAVAHDTRPITDTKSIRGKSVSQVAAHAIRQIQSYQKQ